MISARPRILIKVTFLNYFALEVWVSIESIGYLMFNFLSKKNLGVHVQHMLKMSRVYTQAEILSKILVKNEGKLWTLFTIMV